MLSTLHRGEFTTLLAVVIEAATAPLQPQFDVMHLTDAHWKFLHVITRAWRVWPEELPRDYCCQNNCSNAKVVGSTLLWIKSQSVAKDEDAFEHVLQHK